MKILCFIYDHPRNPWVGGGGSRRVFRVARDLQQRGHQIHLVCGRFPGADSVKEKLPVTCVGSDAGYFRGVFSYARKARSILWERANHFDLIIEDFAPWNPVSAWKLSDVPAVIQLQNYFGKEILRRYGPLGFPFWWRERRYPSKFKHAIVINEALNHRFGIQGEVISMGVEAGWLEQPLKPGENLVYLGRLDIRQKGLDILLKAAARMDLPVKIAGDGPGREWLKRRIQRMSHVEWLGWLDENSKLKLLQSARIVAVPSRYEGQNMVILEAAALGKPCVVSNLPEIEYAVREGFGVSFPINRVADLGKIIQEIWDDPNLLERMGRIGREYVRNRTWPKIVDQFEGFCEAVIAKHRQGG